MRIDTKGGKFGPFTFDGWEVLLFGAIVFLVLGWTVEDGALFLYVGIGLLVLWIVAVVLVNLGILGKRKETSSGGADAEPE